jgi:hypothetical protein
MRVPGYFVVRDWIDENDEAWCWVDDDENLSPEPTSADGDDEATWRRRDGVDGDDEATWRRRDGVDDDDEAWCARVCIGVPEKASECQKNAENFLSLSARSAHSPAAPLLSRHRWVFCLTFSLPSSALSSKSCSLKPSFLAPPSSSTTMRFCCLIVFGLAFFFSSRLSS